MTTPIPESPPEKETPPSATTETLPGAPPTMTPAQRIMLEFLRDHDAVCPVCGYNVRALTRPICPECRHTLTLTVGVTHLQLGWLFAALAPGFFSGIAAIFTLIPIILESIFGTGPTPWPLIALDAFGWISGIAAIALAFHRPLRTAFLTQPRTRQRTIALTLWGIHILALLLFIFIGILFM